MTIIYVYVSIISFCQSECACSLQTVNMAVFFTKKNEINFPKGRALRQMYRVVPQTKRGNLNLYYIKILVYLS